ncbi:hypothetical protein AN916_13315 [Mycobacteroides immunogenum]|uniref:Uncharacterized protein n=1 Tax=Mycobacteroides immunogenum TaxID=83262 RepID=A0A7V8LQA5_9MYCO|nr:hypothetical protein AN908_10015 [Mycobacteroides immunogenum]KPG37760.1 hypothetical protein AN914_15320 [Mycobacteroides immunogenum]KPG54657.1 hypothetical protein AN916_13315 [Mycobacteroides immunogenum]
MVPGAVSGPEPDLGADVLFVGEIPEYGQQWSATDKTRLAYTRALRRIDRVGSVTHSAVSVSPVPSTSGSGNVKSN